MGHFHYWLSRDGGRESLKREAGRQEQADTALDHAGQLSSGRSSTICSAAADVGSLGLRSLLQLNNWQVLAATQMRHDQREPLATPTTDGGRWPCAWRAAGPASPGLKAGCSGLRHSLEMDLIGSGCLQFPEKPCRMSEAGSVLQETAHAVVSCNRNFRVALAAAWQGMRAARVEMAALRRLGR